MADLGEDMTNCPVCFEEYKEAGENIPRILPCHHTLCESCMKRLLRKKSLDCPECRTKHSATKGILSFPQNKYIITNIRTRGTIPTANVIPEIDTSSESQFSKCNEHGKEANLFCNNRKCQKAICISCLIKYHKNHDVVDMEEELKEKTQTLMNDVGTVKQALEAKKSKMLATQKEIKKLNRTCVDKLKARKEEHLRIIAEKYDQLIEEVNDETKEFKADMNDDVVTVTKNIEILSKIEQKTKVPKEELAKHSHVVQTIAGSVCLNLTGTKQFQHVEYEEGKFSMEDVDVTCGRLTREETCMDLSDDTDRVLKKVLTRFMQNMFYGKESGRLSAAPVKCKAMTSISTTCSDIYLMSPTDDNSVVLCGEEDGKLKLMKYDLKTGENSDSVQLKDGPSGMTDIKLDGKSFIALSYGTENKIELRNANNLKQVMRAYSLSHNPTLMTSTPSSSTLLYVHAGRDQSDIMWLDCGVSPPTQTSVTHTRIRQIRDLCYAKYGSQDFLAVTRDDSGANVYSATMDSLESNIKGKLVAMERQLQAYGITADESGHLFICDINNRCIQMFTTEGLYLGALLKEGQQNIGIPIMVRWCSGTSSLVVVHMNNLQYQISVFTVQ